MRVIGVIGRKGGVGKTTVAVHLAAEYAARKRKVVVVDADIQGSATYWADPAALSRWARRSMVGECSRAGVACLQRPFGRMSAFAQIMSDVPQDSPKH